jgi:hypothetical protein
MSDTITKAITRPGVVPAFFAGLGVFALLLVIGFVQAVLTTLSIVAGTPEAGDFTGQIWASQLSSSVAGPLPFAVGVFLCVWQLAPIAGSLRLAHVVTRSVLAALLGGAAMWIVFVVAQVISNLVAPLGGDVTASFGHFGLDLLTTFLRALANVVGYLPVVALACILLWGWLQRHPPGTPARGALDEV